MFNKIIKSILFLLLVFGLQAKAVLVNVPHVKQAKKASALQTVKNKERGSSVDVLTIPGSAAQITPQVFKTLHFIKYSLIDGNKLTESINYLKHIPRSSSIRLASFYQLILYPFHAFW